MFDIYEILEMLYEDEFLLYNFRDLYEYLENIYNNHM